MLNIILDLNNNLSFFSTKTGFLIIIFPIFLIFKEFFSILISESLKSKLRIRLSIKLLFISSSSIFNLPVKLLLIEFRNS